MREGERNSGGGSEEGIWKQVIKHTSILELVVLYGLKVEIHYGFIKSRLLS